jgi:hypothetical protein
MIGDAPWLEATSDVTAWQAVYAVAPEVAGAYWCMELVLPIRDGATEWEGSLEAYQHVRDAIGSTERAMWLYFAQDIVTGRVTG